MNPELILLLAVSRTSSILTAAGRDQSEEVREAASLGHGAHLAVPFLLSWAGLLSTFFFRLPQSLLSLAFFSLFWLANETEVYILLHIIENFMFPGFGLENAQVK